MWAVGVVLFILLGGYHPFDPDGLADDKKMAKAILACRWAFDDPAWEEARYLPTYLLTMAAMATLAMAILAMASLNTTTLAMAALAMLPLTAAGERRGEGRGQGTARPQGSQLTTYYFVRTTD
jgi:hypothetical protein|tara:strand:+ start:119 stop:487 length:369 start_codon:yes stop_codon:yes gene_type:complete